MNISFVGDEALVLNRAEDAEELVSRSSNAGEPSL